MKRIARVTTAVLAVATLAFGTSAAATNNDDEVCVPVVGQAAVPPTYETQPNPDYVPAVPDSTTTVTTQVEYKKWVLFYWKIQWFPVEAQPDAHSGWKATGNVKTETRVVPGTPAIGSPTMSVPNPDYVPAWTEEIPAQGEPTIEVLVDEGQPAIEPVVCDDEPPVVTDPPADPPVVVTPPVVETPVVEAPPAPVVEPEHTVFDGYELAESGVTELG